MYLRRDINHWRSNNSLFKVMPSQTIQKKNINLIFLLLKKHRLLNFLLCLKALRWDSMTV